MGKGSNLRKFIFDRIKGRNMKKIYGFTLSELMIALTVLGILCATVLPAIVKTMPNQNKIMMKRAYYMTTTIVEDMINDPQLYPYSDDSGVINDGFNNIDSVTYGGKTYSGHTKFIDLFANHLNIDGEINTTCPSSGSSGGPTISPGGGGNRTYCRIFTTPDGMNWQLTTGYKLEINKLVNSVLIDVNGDKKPNCLQGDTSADDACKKRTSDFDRFSMTISSDGTVKIPDTQTWAREAIQVSSSLTGKD